MIRWVRSIVLTLAASFISGEALAATQVLQVNASPTKPLTLARLQDLELGTITLKPGIWSAATVSISKAGQFSCATANVVCTGATRTAQYNVQGTNKMVVQITAPNVTLINQSVPGQSLTLVLDNPGNVTLTSSGVPGVDFSIGGSIAVSSATADGTYAGTLNVTVEY